MNKGKLTRLAALCMACLGMGVFAFSGCKKSNGGETGGGNNTEISGGEQGGNTEGGNGSDNENQGGNESGNGNEEQGGNESEGGDGGEQEEPPVEPVEPEEPEIKPVQGGPEITKASAGELETAYVEWTAAENADWYNVYYSPEGGDNWTKLDAPLVRQYKNYFRADAVGLKAGSYDMKVVPVGADGAEAPQYAASANKMAVYAHERSGYAFVNNTSKATASGAYNMDGTLREGAIVLYVTDANFSSVSLEVGGVTVTGLDKILNEGYKEKNGATKPLCVRIIGSIGDEQRGITTDAKGDLNIKGVTQGLTVEGIGNDATANGWGFHITGSSNVEIRNIALMNSIGGTKDGIGFENACDHVWVHNCDFYYGHDWGGDQKKGDGALDTKSCTYVTHSYNRFWDSGKCNLQGMKSEKTTNYITYHHNWFDHSDSRHPRIRTCTVHIYNNYFDGNAKYGVGVTMGASAFVENNYFRSTASMKPMLSSGQGTDALGEGTLSGEAGGMIKSFGNIYDCSASNLKLLTQNNSSADQIDCYEASSRDEEVPESYKTAVGDTAYNNFDTAEDMYEYTVDTAERAKEKVERYAGRVDQGDIRYEFDDATQDANYDAIPELRNILNNYSKTLTLVKVGDLPVGGGSSGEGGSGEGDGGGETPPVNPPETVAGEIVYVPATDGTAGKGAIKAGNGYKSGSAAVTIDGISIAAGKALKIDSSGFVKFTPDKDMTLTLYLFVNSIKVNGVEKTGEQAGGYFVIKVTVSAGVEYNVTKGSKENQLFMLKLTPLA